jgi:uncharacterized protein YjbI with pentapeptide repeats
MLVLLSSSFFILLTTLTVPDRFFIFETEASFTLQGVVLSLQGFLIAASFILIVELVYLHIFYGYWHELEAMDARHERSVPTLFNLNRRDALLATELIFYWWTPLVFFAMAFKATVRPNWAIILYSLATITLAALIFVRIRRCPESRRRGMWRRWAFLALLIASWPVMVVNLYNFNFFRPMDFARAEMPEQRLSSLFLVEANFYRANLSSANLSNSNLRGAVLAGANLRRAVLANANLQNANLKEAKLQEADLSRADLTNADCRLANLTEASLRDANLRSANLSGASLSSVDLQFAELNGALLAHAILRNAHLSDLNLDGLNLESANLEGATLRSTSLVGANLTEVNFREADLRLASLREASLKAADLEGADLEGADLEGADLRGAENVTSEQLIEACGNKDTLLPNGLDRPLSWPCTQSGEK